MSNTTKRALPKSLMNRIKACAFLFLDSSLTVRICAIALRKGITLDDAAVIYTLGALKAAKRRGVAKNFREALEFLENEQMGYRGDRITRTINADKLAGTVQRINRINAGNRRTPEYISVTPAYITVVDNKTVYGPSVNMTAHYPSNTDKPEHASRVMDKVLGTLYTRIEEAELQADPAAIYAGKVMDAKKDRVNDHLTRCFREYVKLLSRISRERLYEVARSTVRVRYLISKAGKEDKDTSRLYWGAYRLYQAFPHKDTVNMEQFIELTRKYVTPDTVTQ